MPAVIGMEKGEEKEVKLEPAKAYGGFNPELKKQLPRDQLPQDQEPKEGMMLLMKLPNGMQLPAKILAVTEKEITVDLNHPLAGKTLNFKFKLVDIL